MYLIWSLHFRVICVSATGNAAFSKSANNINNKLIFKLRCNNVFKKGRTYYVIFFDKFNRDHFWGPFSKDRAVQRSFLPIFTLVNNPYGQFRNCQLSFPLSLPILQFDQLYNALPELSAYIHITFVRAHFEALPSVSQQTTAQYHTFLVYYSPDGARTLSITYHVCRLFHSVFQEFSLDVFQAQENFKCFGGKKSSNCRMECRCRALDLEHIELKAMLF